MTGGVWMLVVFTPHLPSLTRESPGLCFDPESQRPQEGGEAPQSRNRDGHAQDEMDADMMQGVLDLSGRHTGAKPLAGEGQRRTVKSHEPQESHTRQSHTHGGKVAGEAADAGHNAAQQGSVPSGYPVEHDPVLGRNPTVVDGEGQKDQESHYPTTAASHIAVFGLVTRRAAPASLVSVMVDMWVLSPSSNDGPPVVTREGPHVSISSNS